MYFADSFYFFALTNRRDRAHAEAASFSSQCTSPLLTTSWVLTEFADGLTSKHAAVYKKMLKLFDSNPANVIVPATQSLLDEGLDLFFSRPDKNWSLTDCISFVVMQRNGIDQALTGDYHFEQAGFRLIFPQD